MLQEWERLFTVIRLVPTIVVFSFSEFEILFIVLV